MITEYCVLTNNEVSELVALVAYYIKKGWQPLGGVSVSISRDYRGSVYAQAMGKYEKPTGFVVNKLEEF